jgi:amino acid transporter
VSNEFKLHIKLTSVINKTKWVNLMEMDLDTGSREFDDIEDETEEESRYKDLNLKGKIVYQLKNW